MSELLLESHFVKDMVYLFGLDKLAFRKYLDSEVLNRWGLAFQRTASATLGRLTHIHVRSFPRFSRRALVAA